jgi:hypothetical protein
VIFYLEIEEIFVELRVQGVQVIEVHVHQGLSQQLTETIKVEVARGAQEKLHDYLMMNCGSYFAEEEGGERKFYQQVFVQCLRVGLSNTFFLKHCQIGTGTLYRFHTDKRKDTSAAEGII